MRFRSRGRVGWAVVIVVMLGSLGFGVAYATGTIAPSAANTYVGCVAPKSGALSIVGAASQCPKPDSVVMLSGPIDQTVSVNCAAGQSIQKAIDSAPTSLLLTVDIAGVCNEAVQSGSQDIDLVGTSSGAGIAAPSGEPALSIFGSGQAAISQLTLTASSSAQAAVFASSPAFVHLDNDKISGGQFGLLKEEASTVEVVDTTITGNVQAGIRIEDGHLDAGGKVTGLTIDEGGSGQQGVEVGDGATASIYGGLIEHATGQGLDLWNGGSAYLQSVDVEDNGFFGITTDGGKIGLASALVSGNGGGIAITGGTQITLDGSTVSNNGNEAIILAGASVGSLQGDTLSSTGGNVIHLHDASLVAFSGATTQIASSTGWQGIYCEPAPSDPLITGSSLSYTGSGGTTNCPTGT